MKRYTCYLGACAFAISSSVFTWIATENTWHNKIYIQTKKNMSG